MTLDDFINDPDIVVAPPEAFTTASKPKKSREEYVKPVVEYNIDGEFVASYSSRNEASRATGLGVSTIGNICTGKFLFSCKNNHKRIFLFRGADIAIRMGEIEKRKDEYKINHPRSASAKEVCEYTLGGRFLCKYPTTKGAAIVNGTTPQLVTNCCKGIRLFLNKRIFLYPNDNIKERVKLVKAELYKLSQKKPKYREVDEYTLDGVFVKAYPSASAAGRACDIHVSDITRCCNGVGEHGYNRLTTKGKIFLWVGDSISDRLELIKQINKERNAKKSKNSHS